MKPRRPGSALRRAAREAAADGVDEPVTASTEDSFGKILGDIREDSPTGSPKGAAIPPRSE